MNQQHVILYQINVTNPRYIQSLLSNVQEIRLYVARDFHSIKERMQFCHLHCILYECDIFNHHHTKDIQKIEMLHIPYLIITHQLDDRTVDWNKVIIKSDELSISTVFLNQLIVRIKSLHQSHIKNQKSEGFASTHIIGMGASTGGPRAILQILKGLPKDIAGIVIVQHMSEVNIISFVRYLNAACHLKVKIACENDIVKNGVVYIAHSTKHLTIKRRNDGYHLHYIDGEKVNCVRPSIDILFHSIALQAGLLGVGILLTGMGNDGANGLKAMKESGALTIIQDEQTSDLYSMPKEAKKLGAYQKELPIDKISEYLIMYFYQKEKRNKK